jgi:hypothetical protein
MLGFGLSILGFYISLMIVYPYTTFAMHDSTLDVNTWIASDNSTSDWIASDNSSQLHTTDLVRGPISPAVSAGASSTEEKDITVLLRAELQPHENEFLAEDGWYRINSFQFIANDSEEFCPSNNCEYEIEEDTYSMEI